MPVPLWNPAHLSDSPYHLPRRPPSVVLSLVPRFGLHTSFPCLSPQLIEQLKEEIPVLISEVEQMYAGVWDPREVVFKDVLLHRPKYVVSAAVLG